MKTQTFLPAFLVVKYIIFFFFFPPIPAHRGPETDIQIRQPFITLATKYLTKCQMI